MEVALRVPPVGRRVSRDPVGPGGSGRPRHLRGHPPADGRIGDPGGAGKHRSPRQAGEAVIQMGGTGTDLHGEPP